MNLVFQAERIYSIYGLGLTLVIGLVFAGCQQQSSPIQDLWGVTIVSPTPLPAVTSTATPRSEPTIILKPQAAPGDLEAGLNLNVIGEDEAGRQRESTITIERLDGHASDGHLGLAT